MIKNALKYILVCNCSVYDTKQAQAAEAMGIEVEVPDAWSAMQIDLREVAAIRMPKRNADVEEGRDVPEECVVYLKSGDYYTIRPRL